MARNPFRRLCAGARPEVECYPRNAAWNKREIGRRGEGVTQLASAGQNRWREDASVELQWGAECREGHGRQRRLSGCAWEGGWREGARSAGFFRGAGARPKGACGESSERGRT